MTYHEIMRAFPLAVIGLGLFIAGCHHEDPNAMKPGPVHEWARRQGEPNPHNSEEFGLLSNINAFKLFEACDTPGANVMISPVSITMTLSMLANGTKGDTQNLILKMLNAAGGAE